MATIDKFTPPQDSNSFKLGYQSYIDFLHLRQLFPNCLFTRDEASGVVRIYVHLEKNNTNNNIIIKKIMKNNDYTTVLWEDGTHTVVKKMAGEVNDPEKALLFAILKKLCDNNGSKMTRYLEDAEDKTVIKRPKY